MAIGTPLAAAATSGTANASSAPVTIPAGASAGDPAWLVVFLSTGAATCSTPTGWTLVDGPQDDGTSSERAYLFRKTLASGDPGSTVTATWSASGRTGAAVVTVPGASGQDAIVQWTDATADLTLTIPAITPVAADCLELALVTDRYAASGVTGVTPNGAWTELVDVNTTNTSNPRLGAWVAYKQLTGQAGVAQPTYDNTYASNGRNVGWVLTVAPTATSTTYQATGTVTATSAVAGALTAILALTGTAAATSTVSGDVTRVPRIYSVSGTVNATSATNGTPTGLLQTSGTVPAASTVTGNPTALLRATGTAAATSGTSGSLTAILQATGTVAAVTTVTGSPSIIGGPVTLPVTGRVDATSSTAGSITARLTVNGQTSATSTITGSPTALLQTTGIAAATSATLGDVTLIAAPVTYQVTGTVNAISGTSGTVTVTSPSDGRPVDRPTLTLTTQAGALTITSPAATLTLTSGTPALTITTPPSRLELT